MKTLTTSTFQDEISTWVVLVDFRAEWCGPCRILTPVLEDLSTKITDVTFGKVNTDEESDLTSNFGITSIPTVMIFKDGELVDRIVWVNPPNVYEAKLNELTAN